MKKIIKNITRVLFSLLLIVSIFGAFNVLAETVVFRITKIEVKEKSDKVTVNDVSLSGGQLKNDIVFTEKDDYIKYNITIKNATSDEYTIKSISDDNISPYLEYTYDDLSNVKLESGEEKTFELQIKYIQETDNLTISDQAVSLTLTYEKVDGTTGSETITNDDNNNTNTTPTDNGEVKGTSIINPKTGDNITIYIILGIISLIGLAITTVSKKHLSKSLMAITVISMVAIPLGVRAESDKFIVKLNNSISVSHNTIIYNANGGKFDNNTNTNNVNYRFIPIVKYSHTENIDDTGKLISDYGENWNQQNIVGTDRGNIEKPHVITIPGASNLNIDIYYGGEDGAYWVYINEGAHPNLYDYNSEEYDAVSYQEFSGEQTGTYTLNNNVINNIKHENLSIDGDSITFDFYSDISNTTGNKYGYYAVVSSKGIKTYNTIEEPTREGYIFKGWYTDEECTPGNEFDMSTVSGNVEVFAKWKDPNLLEIGDEYCFNIGNECFYTIGYQDSNHVILLAKNSLNLSNDSQYTSEYSDGFINFATSYYWNQENNYPRYVYDSNSLIYTHIENYVNYLRTFGKNVEGRLITYDELSSIQSYEWSDGNYWTGTAQSDDSLYRQYDNEISTNPIDNDSNHGNARIRPVIILELNN